MLPKAASIWEFPQGTDFTITASESKITVKFKDGESSRVITIVSEEPDLSSDFTAPSPADVYFESKDKGEKTKLTAQDVAEIKYLHAQLLERKQWTIRQTNMLLSKQYKCSDKNIDAIIRGRTWPRVKPATNVNYNDMIQKLCEPTKALMV